MDEDAAGLAAEAKAVLDNPAFSRSFDDVLEGVNSTMADLPMDDTSGRLAQTYMVTALAAIKQALLERIQTWQMIQEEAARKQAEKLDKLANEDEYDER